MAPKRTARASAKRPSSTTPVEQSAKRKKTNTGFPKIASPMAVPKTPSKRATKPKKVPSSPTPVPSPVLISSSIKQHGDDWAVSKRVQMALPTVSKPKAALKKSELRASTRKALEKSFGHKPLSDFLTVISGPISPPSRERQIPTVAEFISAPSMATATEDEPRESDQELHRGFEDDLSYDERLPNNSLGKEYRHFEPIEPNVAAPPPKKASSKKQIQSTRDAENMTQSALSWSPADTERETSKGKSKAPTVESSPIPLSFKSAPEWLREGFYPPDFPAWILEPVQRGSEWRAVRTLFEHCIPQLARLEGCGFLNKLKTYEAYVFHDKSPLRYKNDKKLLLEAGDPFGIIIDFLKQAMAVVPSWDLKVYNNFNTHKGLVEAVASVAKLGLDDPPRACEVFQPLSTNPGAVFVVEAFMIPLVCDEIIEKYHTQVFAKPSAHNLAAQGGKLFKELALSYFRGLCVSRMSLAGLVVERGAASILRAWEDAVAWTANLAGGPSKADIWEEVFLACTGHLPPYQDLDGSWYTSIFERPEFVGPDGDDAPQTRALHVFWEDIQSARRRCAADLGLWDPKAARMFRVPTVMRRNLIEIATFSLEEEEAMATAEVEDMVLVTEAVLAKAENKDFAVEAMERYPDPEATTLPTATGNVGSKQSTEKPKNAGESNSGWWKWLTG